MIKKLFRRKKTIIFAVVGTGRSGTHLVGNLISTSAEVTSSIEDGELFPLITNAAVNNSRKDTLEIARLLRARSEKCRTRIYLEKSHPLVWLINDKNILPLSIRYIGIVRDPYATVASMLNHEGVRKWCEEWDKFPQPNLFFGTTEDNLAQYRSMNLTEKCTMRWISHTKELERLTSVLPRDRYLLLKYEDLLAEQNKNINTIESFLSINDIDRGFTFNKSSLKKWQEDLSRRQKKEIDTIIRTYYNSYKTTQQSLQWKTIN